MAVTSRLGLAVLEDATSRAVALVNANSLLIDAALLRIGGTNLATDAQTTYALGTAMFQLQDQIGVGNTVDAYFTKHTTANSGLQGLHLRRKSTNVNPHGVTLEFDTGPLWDTIAVDATTTDLVLAYSHVLAADNLRMRADTAQIALGRVVGQPALGGGQLQITAGSAGVPKAGLTTTVFGNQDGLALLQGTGGTSRGKINLNNVMQFGSDSNNNGTLDFWFFNNGSGGFPFLISAGDEVEFGTAATNSAVALSVPLIGRNDSRATSPLRLKRSVYTFPTDANQTLAAADYRNPILEVIGTIAATRNLVVPLTAGSFWWVRNLTTGGQSIQIIGASGTGQTVTNGKAAILYADGTNLQRMTPDT